MTVDALKDKYPLPSLLKRVSLSKSSYYYRKAVLCQEDKYSSIRRKITELFHENVGRYGYRGIHGLLKREGITLSEKVVRRLMLEEGLWVKVKRRRKCSSYQGEISPSVPNVLERDFHADRPNEKWLTDITEFALPDNWNKPGCPLVNRMPDQAISSLGKGGRPLIHSDRGCHYRWPG